MTKMTLPRVKIFMSLNYIKENGVDQQEGGNGG